MNETDKQNRKIDKSNTVLSARALTSTLPPDLARLPMHRSLPQSQHRTQILYRSLGKRFGQDVCRHGLGLNVLDINQATLDSIPEPVVTQIQVPHSAMVFRVSGDSNGRLVIQV